VLWDVVEEHFQEAAFLWAQRERALQAEDHSLAEVAEGDEYRLVAHLEGLLHAGPHAAERLLVPALREGLPGEVAVAALALLASEDLDWAGEVLSALAGTEHPAALLGGLALSPHASVDGLLRERFPEWTPEVQALVLETLALRRADPEALLALMRTPSEPALLAAALRAARFADPRMALDLVGRGLVHADPTVRDAAIAVGCTFGHREAWQHCRRILEQGEPCPRQALVAWAMGSEAKDLPLLLALLSQPDLSADVLWALGLSGRLEAVEALLARLREGEQAAAGPLVLVSGLPLRKLLEPAEQQEEDAPGQGGVRLEAIETWWKTAKPRLPAKGRYVYGRTWSLEALLTALAEAPGAWRPDLAWELAVRTRGAAWVEPRAWSWEQRQALQAAGRQAPRFQVGPFSRFMST
jgi:uncharacterized protein (TIGR02270 family)